MPINIEVLRELFRITEWKDGCVYKTQYVEDRWADPDTPPPAGHMWVVKSDPNLVTIRRRA